MQKTNALEQLIYFFSKLPGLGHRSSRRIVLHLLEQKDTRLQSMIDILTHARDRIYTCAICGNLSGNVCGNVDSEKICSICSDPARNNSVLAVVETVAELLAIERVVFFGKYHVLGGVLSASASKNPQDLKIENLVKRCKTDNVQEIILATNATIEGQTTAFYILEHFQETNIKITKLASGIPIGGELDYLDEGTLTAAINARLPF